MLLRIKYHTKNNMYKLGCHLSTSDGYKKMGEKALGMDANTFQFFTRNPRGGAAKSLNIPDLEGLAQIMRENDFGDILAHSPYTLNMASANPKTREFAKMVFKDDLERLDKMPCRLYNFHPGSHSGIGLEQGINNIVQIINYALTEDERTFVLLETMSGKGTEIGSTFQELKSIIDRTNYPEKMGVCIDTCHLFCAGYDIVNNLEGVLEEFDDILGIEKIKAVHLNDSMNPFNSRKDRHAGIGEGAIGLEAIIRLITHEKLMHLPFILETPYDIEGHKEEIKRLRERLEGI